MNKKKKIIKYVFVSLIVLSFFTQTILGVAQGYSMVNAASGSSGGGGNDNGGKPPNPDTEKKYQHNKTAVYVNKRGIGGKPKGFFKLEDEGFDSGRPKATGWAYDPNRPDEILHIEFYIDGPIYLGTYMGNTTADEPNKDVEKLYGVPGDHGFTWTSSGQVVPGTHKLYAYAIDSSGEVVTQLEGSPRIFTVGSGTEEEIIRLGDLSGAIPIGQLESIKLHGISDVKLIGWAYDPDDEDTAILVRFYLDGTDASNYIGECLANCERPDINSQQGVSGNHGFQYIIENLNLDEETHLIYAAAYDLSGEDGDPLLDASPMEFTIMGIPNYVAGNMMVTIDSTRNVLTATGWAVLDVDYLQDRSIYVAFYRDSPIYYTPGVYLGKTYTDRYVAIINAIYGIDGNHGFEWILDLNTQPSGWHTLWAYGANLDFYGNLYLYNTYYPIGNSGWQFYVPTKPAIGNHDSVSVDIKNTVTTTGWAFDPDKSGNSLWIKFYLNGPIGLGTYVGSAYTDVFRADVNNAYGISGNHGFKFELPKEFLRVGDNYLYAYAVDLTGDGTIKLSNTGKHYFISSLTKSPIGFHETIDDTRFDNVVTTGWAFDLDSPDTSLTIDFYLDNPRDEGGTYVGSCQTDILRNDINDLYNIGGIHGFEFKVPEEYCTEGPHKLYAYAKDVAGGDADSLIQNSPLSFDIDKSSPIGELESIIVNGASVTATGWAYDPDWPEASVNIMFYLDGAAGSGGIYLGTIPADYPRDDLGVSGDHGFTFILPSTYCTTGEHQLYAYAEDVTADPSSILDGCPMAFEIIILTQSPIGQLDPVAMPDSATTIATGYAYDPDLPDAALTIHFYLDGTTVDNFIGSCPANLPRDGVGDHGFEWIIPEEYCTLGDHYLYAFALDKTGDPTSQLDYSPRFFEITSQPPEGAHEGFLFSLTGEYTTIGIAYDPDDMSVPVTVKFYLDGRIDSGTYVGSCTANIFREGIGNHGFEWTVPEEYCTPGDHYLYAYAVDLETGGADTLLDYSPAFFNVPTITPVEGEVEDIAVVDNTVTISGWTYDPDDPDMSLTVVFYLDGPAGAGGLPVGSCETDVYRWDINSEYSITGTHGFEWSLPEYYCTPGEHVLYVYAYESVGNAKTMLYNDHGSFVILTGSPVGEHESVIVVDNDNRIVTTSGYAFDPDKSYESLKIRFYLIGDFFASTFIGECNTDVLRNDINLAFDISGNHGFEWPIPIEYCSTPGNYILYAYAVDETDDGDTQLVGSPITFEIVDDNTHNILGFHENTVVNMEDLFNPKVTTCGWVFDWDDPSQSLEVEFYLDGPKTTGTYIGKTVANLLREDINEKYGISGAHGFCWEIPEEYIDGIHTIYAYAVDTSDSKDKTLLSNSPILFDNSLDIGFNLDISVGFLYPIPLGVDAPFAVVSGIVEIVVDTANAHRVDFRANNVLLGSVYLTDGENLAKFYLDTKEYLLGVHTLQAVAYDQLGNMNYAETAIAVKNEISIFRLKELYRLYDMPWLRYGDYYGLDVYRTPYDTYDGLPPHFGFAVRYLSVLGLPLPPGIRYFPDSQQWFYSTSPLPQYEYAEQWPYIDTTSVELESLGLAWYIMFVTSIQPAPDNDNWYINEDGEMCGIAPPIWGMTNFYTQYVEGRQVGDDDYITWNVPYYSSYKHRDVGFMTAAEMMQILGLVRPSWENYRLSLLQAGYAENMNLFGAISGFSEQITMFYYTLHLRLAIDLGLENWELKDWFNSVYGLQDEGNEWRWAWMMLDGEMHGFPFRVYEEPGTSFWGSVLKIVTTAIAFVSVLYGNPWPLILLIASEAGVIEELASIFGVDEFWIHLIIQVCAIGFRTYMKLKQIPSPEEMQAKLDALQAGGKVATVEVLKSPTQSAFFSAMGWDHSFIRITFPDGTVRYLSFQSFMYDGGYVVPADLVENRWIIDAAGNPIAGYDTVLEFGLDFDHFNAFVNDFLPSLSDNMRILNQIAGYKFMYFIVNGVCHTYTDTILNYFGLSMGFLGSGAPAGYWPAYAAFGDSAF